MTPPETRIQVGSASRSLPLTVQGLHHVASPTLHLMDETGKVSVTVPKEAFPLRAEPGEIVYATITLLHVVQVEVPPQSSIILPGVN